MMVSNGADIFSGIRNDFVACVTPAVSSSSLYVDPASDPLALLFTLLPCFPRDTCRDGKIASTASILSRLEDVKERH